jgi:hypothetical protein
MSQSQVERPLSQFQSVQDDLAADVRVETERRLKSLQKDLEKAETANKEGIGCAIPQSEILWSVRL